MTLCKQHSGEASEAALTLAEEKTPAEEQKPVESEWLSVSWQDTAAVTTADKHTCSCTQISSLSCEHLLNCSPHSSVSYYLIHLSKCSFNKKLKLLQTVPWLGHHIRVSSTQILGYLLGRYSSNLT